jgi:hypothetical protein
MFDTVQEWRYNIYKASFSPGSVVNLMLALNRSLLNREYIRMNVLKALASIICKPSRTTMAPGFIQPLTDINTVRFLG